MRKKSNLISCFMLNKASLKFFTITILCTLIIINSVFATKKVQAITSSTSTANVEILCSSTAYTGGGVTSTGIPCVRKPFGLSTIAVDPNIIPFNSAVYVEGYGYAIAADCGSAIKGNKIDVYFDSEEECSNWGVKNVTVTILGNSTGM